MVTTRFNDNSLTSVRHWDVDQESWTSRQLESTSIT